MDEILILGDSQGMPREVGGMGFESGMRRGSIRRKSRSSSSSGLGGLWIAGAGVLAIFLLASFGPTVVRYLKMETM